MTVAILKPTPESLATVAAELDASGVVGLPTETVYGLAARAFDEAAVLRVFEVKGRPAFDPLIVHVEARHRSLEALAKIGLVDSTSILPAQRSALDALITEFWPGPLTLVVPKQKAVPDLVTSGLARVAIRMPKHEVAQALLRLVGAPLAAPSANRFGRISPTAAAHVAAELGDRIRFILDGGACEFGLESTVVAAETDGSLALLRSGSIAAASIESVVGRSLLRPSAGGPASLTASPMAAPGQLLSHYAPRKPLLLLPCRAAELTAAGWQELSRSLPVGAQSLEVLVVACNAPNSLAGAFKAVTGLETTVTPLLESAAALDDREAARRLFAVMRELDERPGSDVILAELPPSRDGLWAAIADRLTRASHRPNLGI